MLVDLKLITVQKLTSAKKNCCTKTGTQRRLGENGIVPKACLRIKLFFTLTVPWLVYWLVDSVFYLLAYLFIYLLTFCVPNNIYNSCQYTMSDNIVINDKELDRM
jgi:hypothetical protein